MADTFRFLSKNVKTLESYYNCGLNFSLYLYLVSVQSELYSAINDQTENGQLACSPMLMVVPFFPVCCSQYMRHYCHFPPAGRGSNPSARTVPEEPQFEIVYEDCLLK